MAEKVFTFVRQWQKTKDVKDDCQLFLCNNVTLEIKDGTKNAYFNVTVTENKRL